MKLKLQPQPKKELTHIACGTALCTAVMWVVFAALHLVHWVAFNYTVVLASLIGAAIAVGNFAVLCLTVQQGIEIDDEKKRKGLFQVSYNVRMLVQAAWVVIAIAAPCFQPVAGIAPLLFPRVTIYYLQITGRYKPETPKEPEVSVEEDNGSAPAPASEDEGGEN